MKFSAMMSCKWTVQIKFIIVTTTFRFVSPKQGLVGLSFCVASTADLTCRKSKEKNFLCVGYILVFKRAVV